MSENYDIKCPYCGHGEKSDDYGLDGFDHQRVECSNCGNIFIIESEITYTVHKADCLNGGEHNWIMDFYKENQTTDLTCIACFARKINI